MHSVRVLDLGTFIACPAATLLGEFGAEVVNGELSGLGDHARRFGNGR